MAGHAGLVLGESGDLFPHGESGIKVGVLELDGIGWGFEETTENISAQVDTAVDGGGLLVVGKGGEDVGVGEEAGPLSVGGWEKLEGAIFGRGGSVEFSEAGVKVDVFGGEQAAVVGGLGPDDIIDEKVQRGSQVGDDVFIESGEGFRVFVEVFFFGKGEPVVEKGIELGSRTGVAKHAPTFVLDLLWSDEVSFLDELLETFVGDGIPEGAGEMGGCGVLIVIALFVPFERRIEEGGRGQSEHEGALGGGLVVASGLGEDGIDVGLVLFRGEGAGEGAAGEVGAELFELFGTVRLVGFSAGEFIDVIEDEHGGLDGGIGDGFTPGFGNGGATFVAH